jgi:uncharacterized protein YndB with AHSA1/START domain
MTSSSFENKYSAKLQVEPAKVFAALTEPESLRRWFAEHVEIDLREGGAYRFWGPAVLGAPSADEATQAVLSVEKDRSLRYRWRLFGVDSEVRYHLESVDDGAACQLTILHAVSGALPFPNPRHAVDDYWRLAAGNLMAHVMAYGSVVLADFTRPTNEVIVSVEIAAPPAKVFRVLTIPELMNKWIGSVAKVDLASSEYSWGMSYEFEGKKVLGGPTRILELVPDQKLVTDWPDWRGDETKPKTQITWELTPLPPDGTRTKLTLTHSGFAHPVERSDYQQGWVFFLESLRTVAEGGGESVGAGCGDQ